VVRTQLPYDLGTGIRRHGRVHARGADGEPADIGRSIAFLVSDAAGWITGETPAVDGGQPHGPSMAFEDDETASS